MQAILIETISYLYELTEQDSAQKLANANIKDGFKIVSHDKANLTVKGRLTVTRETSFTTKKK